MAITGTHLLLYSSEPEALRALLKDAFGFHAVDAGEGWLIFALPPAELGVHPADGPPNETGTSHQITFLCDDIYATIPELQGKGVRIEGQPRDAGWGITAMMSLPGGVRIMLYQPRHPVAIGSALPR